MIVNPDSAVPLWRQVAAWIAGRIAEPGQRLPSEATIMQELGVSRGTVRQAYRYLAKQGWAVVVSGKGAFAADPLPPGKPEI
jgi:DNA-binding GntR family transcriptional regulator